MASPMPLEAPVTRAARSDMRRNQTGPDTSGVPLVSSGPGDRLPPPRWCSTAGRRAPRRRRGRRRSRRSPKRVGASADCASARARPVTVTPGQAQRRGAGALDDDYPQARRRADERGPRAARPAAAGPDLGEVAGRSSARRWRATTTRAPAAARRRGRADREPGALRDDVAHELAHALDDQRFDLDADASPTATTPGSPTRRCGGLRDALMYRYMTAASATRRRSAVLAAWRSRRRATCRRSWWRSCCSRTPQGESSWNRLLKLGGGGWEVVTPRCATGRRPPPSRSCTRRRKSRPTSRARGAAWLAGRGRRWSAAGVGKWLTAAARRRGRASRLAARRRLGRRRYGLFGRGDERRWGSAGGGTRRATRGEFPPPRCGRGFSEAGCPGPSRRAATPGARPRGGARRSCARTVA